MRLKHEPWSGTLFIHTDLLKRTPQVMGIVCAKKGRSEGNHAGVEARGWTFFFFTLVTGPRRSLSLKLSDTRVKCEGPSSASRSCAMPHHPTTASVVTCSATPVSAPSLQWDLIPNALFPPPMFPSRCTQENAKQPAGAAAADGWGTNQAAGQEHELGKDSRPVGFLQRRSTGDEVGTDDDQKNARKSDEHVERGETVRRTHLERHIAHLPRAHVRVTVPQRPEKIDSKATRLTE